MSAQLRESYIGISRYVSGYTLQSSCTRCSCPQRSTRQARTRTASRPFSSINNYLWTSRGGAITQGFPDPPIAQKPSEGTKDEDGTPFARTASNLDKLPPSASGPDTPIDASAQQAIAKDHLASIPEPATNVYRKVTSKDSNAPRTDGQIPISDLELDQKHTMMRNRGPVLPPS